MSVTSQSGATMNIVFAGDPSPTHASLGANVNATDPESQGITDPRAKKRLQNRVAQRSYRRRVKSRIADLQKKVAQYEDANSLKQGPETGDQPRVHEEPLQQRVLYTSPETASWRPIGSRPTCEKTQESSDHGNSHDTLSPAVPLVPGNQILGLTLSNAGRSFHQNGSGHEAQQSRRLSLVAESHETNGDLRQAHFDDITVKQTTASDILQSFPTSTFDTATSSAPFTTDDLEGQLDIEWMIANTEVEARKSCSCEKPPDQNTKVSSTKAISLINQSSTTRRPSYVSSSRSPATTPRESLNARFQEIMECVAEMGFESFDDLVTSYYTDEFEQASKLFHEQRFSRIRRLPGVFAEILEGARNWEPLECRGIGEEILKEAEAVLMLESNDAWQSLQSITDTAMTQGDISTEQVYQSFSTLLPIQMPKLWTLLMALVASDCPAWQRDCSGTALAITALLHFTGRMPKCKMLELISLCLAY